MRPLRHGVFLPLLLVAVRLAGAIRGKVVDASGAPVDGARVSLFAAESEIAVRARLLSDAPERKPLEAARTDARGSFSIRSSALPANLQVLATGFAPVELTVEPEEDCGTIALAPASPVRGSIQAEGKGVPGALAPASPAPGSIQADGKGVPGALVVIRYRPGEILARSGPDGRIEVPAPSLAWSIAVLHPRYEIDEEWFLTESGVPSSALHRTLRPAAAREGRVVDAASGRPIAGATVAVHNWPLATSGEDGRFLLSRAPANATRLTASLGDRIGVVALAAKDLDVRLAEGDPLEGRVVDATDGRPVVGARVSTGGPPWEATSDVTDSRGRFRILAPSGAGHLVAEHPGFVPEIRFTAASGTGAEHELRLQPLVRVRGRVVAEDETPIGGATLRIDDGSRVLPPARAAQSGPDGAFVLRTTGHSAAKLVASAPGYAPVKSETMKLVRGEALDGVVLVMSRGIEVAGRIADDAGNPLDSVAVHADPTAVDGPRASFVIPREGEAMALTSSDGRFRIHLTEGLWDLRFERDGYLPKRLRAHRVTGEGAVVEASLQQAVEIRGRVVRGGAGVEGRRLRARSDEVTAEATTGAGGEFVLSGLRPGPVRVSVGGRGLSEERMLTAPASGVVLELPEGVRVRGRVLDRSTGGPLTDFTVGMERPRTLAGGSAVGTQFANDDGSFVLEDVPVGAVILTAEAEGYAPVSRSLDVESGKPLDGLVFELDRGLRVYGRVHGPRGEPLEDVQVLLTSPAARAFPSLEAVRTDADGAFRLSSLSPGEVRIRVVADGFVPATRDITLGTEDVQLDVRLETAHRLTGNVVDEAGVPVPDAAVRVYGADRAIDGRTTGQGAFEIDGLGHGPHTVRVSKPGLREKRIEGIDPAAAGGPPLRIVLLRGAVLEGRVVGPAGHELASASVEARGPNSSVSAPVSADGRYRMEGLEPGTHSVLAVIASRGSGPRISPFRSVEIPDGGSVELDLEIPAGVVVRGRVVRNGLPAAGAEVSFHSRLSGSVARAVADDEGRYELHGVEEGQHEVRVWDAVHRSQWATLRRVEGSGTQDFVFTTRALRGRVVDAGSGAPLPGVDVEVRMRRGSAWESVAGAVTDALGAFAVDDIASERFQLAAVRAGYAIARLEVPAGDVPLQGIELALQPAEGLLLRLVDARSGVALRGSAVAFDSSGSFVAQVATDGDACRLPLSPGAYSVLVTAFDHARRVVQVTAPGQFTVQLPSGGTLIVASKHPVIRNARLIDAAGRPVPFSMRLDGLFGLRAYPEPTHLEDLAPGAYLLTLYGEDRTSVAATVSLTIEEGATVRVEI